MGTQEFAGMGNRVNDRQTRRTDKLQMMMSHQGRRSQSHKRIAQTNHTKQVTEFRQPLQVQSHLEMPRILVQLGHIQRT